MNNPNQTYLCPKCGKEIKTIKKPCESCGFPVQDLDAIFQNVGKKYIRQFYLAIAFNQKEYALKSLGVLDYMDVPNYNYYQAYYYYANGEFIRARSSIASAETSNDDALRLEADIASELVDCDSLKSIYNKGKERTFSRFQVECNKITCLTNAHYQTWDKIYEKLSWIS